MTETMIDMRWSKPFEIGPRQTVDRARHPTLGDGRLVHRHGPSFFLSDSGECVALENVSIGGASSNPRRSWMTAKQDGRHVEFDVTDCARGDRHDRVFARMLGTGWLVVLGIDLDRKMAARFEGDDGRALPFTYHVMHTGLPEHDPFAQKMSKQRQDERLAAEEAGWFTYNGADGPFTWCHERDKDKALHYLEHRNDPKPEKPKRKKAPMGPMPDFASMTREQIKAWQEGAR